MEPKCIRRKQLLLVIVALTCLGASAPRVDPGSAAAWEERLAYADSLMLDAQYAEAAEVLSPQPPPALAHSAIAIRRLYQQSFVQWRLVHEREALRLSDDAMALAEEYARPLLAPIYSRRSEIEYGRSNYKTAEKYALEALRLSRRYGNKLEEASTGGVLTRLYTHQARYREAIAYGRDALRVAKTLGGAAATVVLTKLQINVGWAYIVIGEYAAGAAEMKNALVHARDYDRVACVGNFGDLARQQGDHRAALSYYRSAVALARRVGQRDVAEFLDNEAAELLALRDTNGARVVQREALASEEITPDERLRSRLIDARIDAASNDVESAIAKAQAIVSDTKPASPQRFEAQGRLASFYAAAGRTEQAERTFARALATAEKTRDSIRDAELQLPFGAVVRETYDEWVDFLAGQDRAKDALAASEESRAQTLRDAFQGGDDAPLDDVRQIAAGRGATLLAYWLAPRQSFVWVVTPQTVTMQRLPPREAIERELDAYRKEMFGTHSGSAATLQHGQRLFEMLVPPAARLHGGARIVVVPDGALHSFNLETLVTPGVKRYWIEDVTIETTPSLSLLAREAPPRDTGGSMLVVGNPAQADRAFPPLAHAADEIERVRRRFAGSCTTLTGAAATPSAYERIRPERFDLIHFAAHGVASQQWPLDSAVILARDRNSYQLLARDVISHPIHARLVTISSCDSAGKQVYTGEGLVGLAWAFLRAGAHEVIAARWEVDDATAPKLMDDLYAQIHAGRDPATALRNAKLHLLSAHGAERFPRFWAPFVLYSGS